VLMSAEHFEPQVGSTPGSVVGVSTWGAGYPSHTVASSVQSLLVSGVQIPVFDTLSGARSRLLDPPECYAFLRDLSQLVEHPSTPGRLLSVPVMATVQTTTTTTITSTVAIPVAQAGSVYTPHTGQAPPSGPPMTHLARGAADFQHPTSTMLINPMEVCPEVWAGLSSRQPLHRRP